MAKQLNVNLKFTADTQQAKMQLQQLQAQLSSITAGVNVGGNIAKDIQTGIGAAAQLKAQLQAATNINTGKLDLGKFNQQMAQSGMSIQKYASALQGLGPQGVQAFTSLTRSIANAEIPIIRISNKVQQLGTVIANTAKWQISSSLLQGFTGAISQAYEYVQDLNKSLNDIRIVTGASVEEMDRFAESANKAAKALSTSTKAYTEAALIYFQQGLENDEVIERTNATIKLANVTGENAQTVSEWMTAIWNNFDNGSKSLEYYADVLTALGAATASSSDEIAGGLEKFAAVAETVGLSYEYATAALATITATTRQSEDVVGTALKTLFARIQDLDLGKTLEDGTDLGAYSQALKTVGIDVKTASGELKDMNSVLNEMGATWKTLEGDQQVALAKSVAGIRQYNQLIALMNNWDYFKENAAIAESASGTLQEQQDIYAEGWEAASERVGAALETIYNQLLDDDFFIDILNGLEDTITFVSELIDSLGGMPGLLTTISALMFNIFGDQMAKGLNNVALGIKSLTKAGREDIMETKYEAFSTARNMASQTLYGDEGTALMSTMQQESEIQEALFRNQSKITEEEMATYKIRLDGLRVLQEQNVALNKQKDTMSANIETQRATLLSRRDFNQSNIGRVETLAANLGTARANFASLGNNTKDPRYNEFQTALTTAQSDFNREYEALRNSIGRGNGAARKELEEFMKIVTRYHELEREATIKSGNAQKVQEDLLDDIKNSKGATKGLSDGVIAVSSAMSSVGMAASSLYGAIGQLNSMWEEGEFSISGFLSALTSVGMSIPMLISSFSTLRETFNADSRAKMANTILTFLHGKAIDEEGDEAAETAALIALQEKALKELNEEELKALVLEKLRGNKFKKGENYYPSGNKTVGEVFTEGEIKESGLLDKFTKKIPKERLLPTLLKTALPVAAALAIVATAWVLADKAANKHVKTLEKAKEVTKQASENYKTISENVKEFNDAAEAYHTAEDGLNKLTRGTLEYSQALLEANEKAWELIESSERLKQPGAYQIVNGEVVINEAALKEAQQEKLQEQQNAMSAKQMAQIRQNDAQANYNKVETLKDIDSLQGMGNDKGAFTTGAAAAATAGLVALSLIPVVGWIGGAVAASVLAVGSIAMTAVNEIEGTATQQEIATYDALDTAFKNNKDLFTETANGEMNENFRELAEANGANAEALWENRDAIRDSIIENEKLRLQNLSLEKTVAANAINALDKPLDARIASAVSTGLASVTGGAEYKEANAGFRNALKGQDDALRDLYAEVYKSEKKTLENMAGSKISIAIDGTVENKNGVSQESVANNLVDTMIANIQSAGSIEKEEELIEQYKEIIDRAEGVSDTNKDLLKGYLDALKVQQEIEREAKEQTNKQKVLTTIEGFDAFSDQTKVGQVLDALETASATNTAADLTFLSKEDFETLTANASLFDADTQKLIKEAGSSREDIIRSSIAKQNTEYVHANKEAEKLQSTLDALELSNEDWNNYVKSLARTYKISDEYAQHIAESNLDAQKGTQSLYKTLDKYNEHLNDANKDTIEYAQGIAALQKDFATWFGVEIDSDTAEKLLPDFRKAVEGDIEAIGRLQKVAQEKILLGFELNDADLTTLTNLTTQFETSGIQVGMNLDSSVFGQQLIQTLNNMIVTAQITSEDAAAYLRQLGIEVDVTAAKIEKLEGRAAQYVGQDVQIFTGRSRYFGNTITDPLSTKVEEANKTSKKSKKQFNEEIERYYELKKAIESTEKALDNISKAKDRAFGNDKLSLMKQESEEIQKQLDLEQQLQKAMEADLKKDRANLNAYGFSTDANGLVNNYEEAYKKAIKYYNSLGEDGDEWWSDFEKALNQYEETLSGVQDQQSKVIDLQNELQDLALEKIEYTVQLKVDAADDDLAVLEFLMQTVEDDAFAAAEAIEILGDQTAATMDKIAATREGIAKTEEALAKGEISPAQAAEKLREYRDELISLNAEMLEFENTVQEKLVGAYDAWNEKLQTNSDIIKHHGTMINNYKNIVDLVGKKTLNIDNETMEKFREAQVANANSAIVASKAALDAKKAYLEELKAQPEGVIDPKTIEKAEEDVRAATETFMEDWQSGLETINQAFKEHIGQIVEDFEKSISGIYDTLEEVEEAFGRQAEINERYLENYEKTYEISKLNRQIQNSIDKTDNLGSQKAFAKLQKELLAMNEAGVEVSERDVEMMRKRYDLLVAEQALKDAQNAKSVVRLQRDSAGNFGYVYTADQTNIDNAQQTYEDKLYDIQKYGEETLWSIQETVISIEKEMSEAFQKIAEDESLSDEEKKEKWKETKAYLLEKYKYWTGEGTKALEFGKTINTQYNTAMADSFNDTYINKINPNITSFGQLYTGTHDAANQTSTNFDKALETHQSKIEKAFEAAGISVKNFGDLAKEKLNLAQTESKETADSTEAMAKKMKEALEKAIGHVTAFYKGYSSKFGDIRDENLETITSIGKVVEELEGMESQAGKTAEKLDGISTAAKKIKGLDKDGDGYIPDGIKGYNPQPEKEEEIKKPKDMFGNTLLDTTNLNKISNHIKENAVLDKGEKITQGVRPSLDNSYYIRYNDGTFGRTTQAISNDLANNPSVQSREFDGNYWYYSVNINGKTRWIRQLSQSFDTGGYTGAWGPEGRLAMLHQKELVLNAHDTENFLMAIGIVRDMADKLEMNAKLMQMPNVANNYQATLNKMTGDTLEQNVHITAEFPNATNHNEIEEAFRNLTNLASQYANRK